MSGVLDCARISGRTVGPGGLASIIFIMSSAAACFVRIRFRFSDFAVENTDFRQ
jgi:hypothetical protein